jgi:hypothetical protein
MVVMFFLVGLTIAGVGLSTTNKDITITQERKLALQDKGIGNIIAIEHECETVGKNNKCFNLIGDNINRKNWLEIDARICISYNELDDCISYRNMTIKEVHDIVDERVLIEINNIADTEIKRKSNKTTVSIGERSYNIK